MRARLLFAVALSLAACHEKEDVQTVTGPPLTIVRVDAAAAPATTAGATPTASAAAGAPQDAGAKDAYVPVTAKFVDLSAGAMHVEHVACEQRIVAPVDGKVQALGQTLGPGDVLVTQGKGGYEVTGKATVAFAIARGMVCEPGQFTRLEKKVLRARAVPQLTWAGGKMRVRILAEKGDAPYAAISDLEVATPVAEHAHPGSWEVLCVMRGSGTLTLAGKARHFGPREVVSIPPGTLHALTPDPGARVVALQFYAPHGPEQRFRALAADGGR